MDLDVIASNGLVFAVLVEINLDATLFIPDSNAGRIVTVIRIGGPYHERISFAGRRQFAIDRAGAFELGIRAALVDDQPLVLKAFKAQVAGLKAELGVTCGHGCAVLVLGDKAKRCPAGCAVTESSAGIGRRVNPASAGHKAVIGIVDDDELMDGAGRAAIVISDSDSQRVDTGCCVSMCAGDAAGASQLANRPRRGCVITSVPDGRMAVENADIAKEGAGADFGIE